jgi:glutathione S-transferase
MSAFTLKYWNGRGLMEVPRQMLAIAGKFPSEGHYVDGRYSSPDGDLSANLGRMPLLDLGDASIGQSAAINFYVATEVGLMGTSALEAAQIIAISEHVKEMLTAFRGVVAYGAEPTEEQQIKWFDEGATDAEGPADGSVRSSRFLTWWMGRLENALTGSGFAVGNQLSYADVLLYNAFVEHLKPEEVNEGTPSWKMEPFTHQARMEAKLAQYPKISASCAAVAANENFQRWLATRGVQGF